MRSASNRERLETAFTVAEQDLGISRLLDPEVRGSSVSLIHCTEKGEYTIP